MTIGWGWPWRASTGRGRVPVGSSAGARPGTMEFDVRGRGLRRFPSTVSGSSGRGEPRNNWRSLIPTTSSANTTSAATTELGVSGLLVAIAISVLDSPNAHANSPQTSSRCLAQACMYRGAARPSQRSVRWARACWLLRASHLAPWRRRFVATRVPCCIAASLPIASASADADRTQRPSRDADPRRSSEP